MEDVRVTVSDDSVKSDLVQIRSLELQHLVDASTVDGICGLTHLLWCTIHPTKASLDQLLAILVKQIECRKVSTGGDFDQLRKTVADLCFR